MSNRATSPSSVEGAARRIAAATALTATLVLGPALSPATGEASTAPPWHRCETPAPDGAGYFFLRYGYYSGEANCRRARWVAHRYAYDGERKPGRWRCRFYGLGVETGIVLCHRGPVGPWVAFRIGA